MKRLPALTAAVLMAATATSASATTLRSSAVSASSWVNTKTLALPLKADFGAVPAAMPMTVVLSLVPRDRAGAEAYVRHEYTKGDSLYHHFLKPAQFAAAFGPAPAEVSAATSYLASQGFHNITVSRNSDLVRAEANSAIVSRAFNTSIHGFALRGKAVYANTSAAQVPAALGSVVQSVLGLHNVASHLDTAYRNNVAPAAVRANMASSGSCIPATVAPGLCTDRSFTTNQLRQFYGEDGTATASNTKIAIMSIGDLTGVIQDLRLNERDQGLRQVPVTVVPVDYQSQEQYGTTEFDMDSQTSSGIAGDVAGLDFYNMGELYESEIAQAFEHWVDDDTASVASASFGECELQAALDGGMLAEDFILTQAVAQGQTLFSSAGDAGSTCGFTIATNGTVPGDGPPQVEYPASSPWVLGAGGTTLFAEPDGSYGGEISWDNGGGGISEFEGPPFWTNGVSPGVVPVYSTIGGPGIAPLLGYNSGRTVPDVSMDADAIASGAQFYSGGSLTTNGGTSLASPLAAGVFARLQSRHNNQLGNGGPALYGNYLYMGGGLGKVSAPSGRLTQPIGGFNDVLVGANGTYTALPGYDMNTGMGSFNINQLLIAFGS